MTASVIRQPAIGGLRKQKPETAAPILHMEKPCQTGSELSGVRKPEKKSSRNWATNGIARKRSGVKPTEANGSQTSAPAAQADWYGDATEIRLERSDRGIQ